MLTETENIIKKNFIPGSEVAAQGMELIGKWLKEGIDRSGANNAGGILDAITTPITDLLMWMFKGGADPQNVKSELEQKVPEAKTPINIIIQNISDRVVNQEYGIGYE